MITWNTYEHPVEYTQAIKDMNSKVEGVIAGTQEECVFLLEHEDVYTIGTSGNSMDILKPGATRIINTDRGGQITYHGKGQRVIYPILNLAFRKKDIRWYVNSLSDIVIALCKHFNLDAFYDAKNVGVWVQTQNNLPKKIASIGIRIKKWVTYHGVAININPDMAKFANIRPCGLDANLVTSFDELGIKTDYNLIDEILRYEFYKTLI